MRDVTALRPLPLKDPFASLAVEPSSALDPILDAIEAGQLPASALAGEGPMRSPYAANPAFAHACHQHDLGALLLQQLAELLVQSLQDHGGAPCVGGPGPSARPTHRPTRPSPAPASPRRSAAPRSAAPKSEPASPASRAPVPAPPKAPPRSAPGTKDRELEVIQARSVESAQRELAAGVREVGTSNRSERIDEYAKAARMAKGNQWCGYFANFNYDQAAKESGVEWKGYGGVVGKTKARAYFNYRSATNGSAEKRAELAETRARHEAEGSTRRYMTFAGSAGEAEATKRGYSPERYADHRELPIRPGDMAVFSHGHVGMVESYDPATGRLTTLEGNTAGGRVARKAYDLSTAEGRATFEGFGRMARGDFAGELST